MDFFYSIDVSIFYFINGTLANPVFDKLMPFITEVKNWYLVYVLLWFIILFKGGKYRFAMAISMILLITITDQVSSSLLKNLFERVRPCNALPDVHLLAGCTGSYSFPSSHAVNNFAAATFFSFYYKHLKWLLFSVAVIIALSRIFVGVHYPSDVLGGAVIGTILGYLCVKLTERILRIIYE
ncbi:MAG: phosphatase PAP2 family protein [Ignavibacteria bacterium]|nr:phosphatase PAP2 family protein [Ignavibacteria bacterium]